jgi:hypothetical protein
LYLFDEKTDARNFLRAQIRNSMNSNAGLSGIEAQDLPAVQHRLQWILALQGTSGTKLKLPAVLYHHHPFLTPEVLNV